MKEPGFDGPEASVQIQETSPLLKGSINTMEGGIQNILCPSVWRTNTDGRRDWSQPPQLKLPNRC